MSAGLDVFYGDAWVGTVHDSSPLAFEYAPAWLESREAFALAQIAWASGRQQSPEVQAFFENLLPEGEMRLYLAQRQKASTLFAQLREVAGDTAGAFVLMPQGHRPEAPVYEATTWEALATIVRNQSAAAIHFQGGATRISLAGAQDKASIAIFDGTTPMLPRGSAPSTHIFKPDIRRMAKIRESAANEAIVMRAATRCGLNTAQVRYEPVTRSCLVERFDRFHREDGSLGRWVQYDFCQIAGLTSDRKYEKEGGPGVAQCADIIRRYSARAVLDLQAFAQWIFFNLYVGNNNSHAKNISLYARPGEGVRLTPFYDLMCTRIYPGLSKDFAFEIGGEVLPGAIGAEQVQGLARQIGMQPRYLQSLALALADRVPAAIDQAIAEVSPLLSRGGRGFADKLGMLVKSTTRRAVARIGK